MPRACCELGTAPGQRELMASGQEDPNCKLPRLAFIFLYPLLFSLCVCDFIYILHIQHVCRHAGGALRSPAVPTGNGHQAEHIRLPLNTRKHLFYCVGSQMLARVVQKVVSPSVVPQTPRDAAAPALVQCMASGVPPA